MWAFSPARNDGGLAACAWDGPVPDNGRVTALPRIAMPARLSDAEGADARVGLANAIFDDVAALVRAEELDVVVVRSVDLAGFDGVVLPGGGDLDPARYGGDTAASVYDVNAEQDDLDLGIARAAAEAGIPILGVCRGLQALNVAFGGTLVDTVPVASGHHQAVRALGAGLVATAVAEDGVVEAVEHESLPIIAVQWHPEAEGTPAHLAAAPFAVFADLVHAGRLAAR